MSFKENIFSKMTLSKVIDFVKISLTVVLFFCISNIAFAQCPTATSLNQSFCDIQSPTVADLQATDNGGGIAWFNSLTSTTPLLPGAGLVSGVYFLDNSTGNCGTRVPVIVTVFGPPIGQNFQGVCVENAADATISDLTAVGFNVQWFSVPVGGTPLAPSTVLVPSTIYYVSQTNPFTGCQTSRLSVFVFVGIVPVPSGDTTQIFCNDPSDPPTVADLIASGNNNWYLTSSSAQPLPPETLLINGQNYYATTTSPPCESTNRLEVNVVLEPFNNPGQNGTVQICEANISTTPSLNLFDFLLGTPQNTGTWTGPLPTSGGSLGTIDVSLINLAQSPYVFTYTVASSTTCAPASATVTLTVSPVLNPGTDGAITLCSNSPSVDLFTLLGGSPDVGGTWSPALASGTGLFNPAVDTAAVYTYTLTGTTPCPDETSTVTVTVNPLPDAGIDAVETLCQNNTPIDLFTLLGGTPDAGGTWSPALASGTGIFDPAVDPAGTYTYTVSGIAPCPNQSATVTIIIVPQPNPGTDGAITLCSNSPSVDLFTLLGGSPDVGGTWSPALASGTGLFNPAVDTAAVYTYTLTGTAPCPDETSTVTVTVNPLPDAGIDAVETLCQNSTPIDLFTLLGGTPDAGGTWSPALASGTGIFDPAVDTAGTYTYTVSGIAPCPNQSATVTIIIVPQPNPGTDGAITLCSNSPSVDLFTLLGGSPDVGGTWSPALASGTGLFNPAVDTAAVYTYTLIGIAPCPDETSTVTVTVNPLPDAGIDAVETLCQNNTPIDLFTLLGGTPDAGGTWSPALASGTGIFDPAVDPAGTYTYTVSGIAPCPNQSATVTITIIAQPNPGTDGAITLCSNSPSVDLFTLLGGSPDVGGTWSPALASGTGLFNPAVDTAAVYTYTLTGTAPCPDEMSTVTVTVNPLPDAGIDAVETLCQNNTPIDLFTLLGGTPDAGGTWSPALASGTGIFDPAVDPAGTYTYTVSGIAPCPNQSATVTIIIVPQPNPGTDGAITLCSNSPSVDLFTLLGGSPDVGGTWSPALASGTGLFNPAVDTAAVYTYTLAGTALCPTASSTVTVTVNPLPDAGIDAVETLCQNNTPIDLFTLLGGTPDAGGTWSPALASGTGIFDPAVDPAGTYTYTVSGIAPCPNQSATVTITIIAQPNPGTNGAVTLCNTSEPIDLFTVLGGTPDVGGTWSPALLSGTSDFIPGFDSEGVYTYTLPGNSNCPDVFATVTVTINEEPFAGTNTTIVICNTSTTIDLYTQLGGNPDTGGAPDTGGVWVPPLSGGNGIFDPAVDPAGVYTYIVAGIAPCPDASATVTIVVNMPPNAGTDSAVSICQNSAPVDLFTLLGGTPDAGGTWSPALASGTGLFNPAIDVSGDYTYTVVGSTLCPDASATVTITVTPLPNAGTFLGPQNVCNTTFYDLFLLLDGSQQSGGIWTNSNGNTISNIINASTFAFGTYSFTYTVTNLCGSDAEVVQLNIIGSPTLSSSDLAITTPICQNQAAIVTVNNLPDGTYSLLYSLSGANTVASQTALVTSNNGVTTFVIDGTTIPNIGITTVTINAITDTVTNCTGNLTNVSIDLEILSLPTLENSNLSVSIICLGQDSVIQITGATNLPDGNYEFLWSIPNAVPTNGTTGFVPISGGSGQFTIPGYVFPVPDTYILTITTINSEVGSCNNLNVNAQTVINVFPMPSIDMAQVTIGTTCLNEDVSVSISNASNLSDGTYQLTYSLSGAVSTTATISVTFTSGAASFILPATSFNVEGSYTLTIANILSQTTTICGVSGNSFPPVSFTLEAVGPPQLIDLGSTFCEDINATIAELTANVVGSDTVNWYDAAVGGNLLDSSTVLVDGATYYGEQVSSSGCVSNIRLEVTITIINCSELIIPDGFSPNGDGINDNFVIKNIRDLYPQFTLEVFNRYGTVLYTGDTSTPDWDGTAQKGLVVGDSELPTGVYFFIINFNDGDRRPYQGRVYLSR